MTWEASVQCEWIERASRNDVHLLETSHNYHTLKAVAAVLPSLGLLFLDQFVPVCIGVCQAMGFPSSAVTPTVDSLGQPVLGADPSKTTLHATQIDWAMELAMGYGPGAGGEKSKAMLLVFCITGLA